MAFQGVCWSVASPDRASCSGLCRMPRRPVVAVLFAPSPHPPRRTAGPRIARRIAPLEPRLQLAATSPDRALSAHASSKRRLADRLHAPPRRPFRSARVPGGRAAGTPSGAMRTKIGYRLAPPPPTRSRPVAEQRAAGLDHGWMVTTQRLHGASAQTRPSSRRHREPPGTVTHDVPPPYRRCVGTLGPAGCAWVRPCWGLKLFGRSGLWLSGCALDFRSFGVVNY